MKAYSKIKSDLTASKKKTKYQIDDEPRLPLTELKTAHRGFGPNTLPQSFPFEAPPGRTEIDLSGIGKTPKKTKKHKKTKSQAPPPSVFQPPSGAFSYSDEENCNPEFQCLSEIKKKSKRKSEKPKKSKKTPSAMPPAVLKKQ